MTECRHGLDEATCSICLGRTKDVDPTDGYRRGTCSGRTCQAEIIWATDASTGRAKPLDPEPTVEGNVKLLGGGLAQVLGARAREADPSPLFMPHHATCPNAADFRGPKGGRR